MKQIENDVMRYLLFERDNFTCVVCGCSNKDRELHVHHIHPLNLGGTDTMNNMITVCDKHHRSLEPKEIINYANKSETKRLRNAQLEDKQIRIMIDDEI